MDKHLKFIFDHKDGTRTVYGVYLRGQNIGHLSQWQDGSPWSVSIDCGNRAASNHDAPSLEEAKALAQQLFDELSED